MLMNEKQRGDIVKAEYRRIDLCIGDLRVFEMLDYELFALGKR
jgi:hypothetical protein